MEKFRQMLDDEFVARMSAATNRAVNIRPSRSTPATVGPGGILIPGQSATTAEEITFQYLEALSEARAYGNAQRIVNEIFAKLTTPKDEETTDKPKRERIY